MILLQSESSEFCGFQGVYPLWLIDGLELLLYDLRYSIDMLNTTSIQLFLLTNQIRVPAIFLVWLLQLMCKSDATMLNDYESLRGTIEITMLILIYT